MLGFFFFFFFFFFFGFLSVGEWRCLCAEQEVCETRSAESLHVWIVLRGNAGLGWGAVLRAWLLAGAAHRYPGQACYSGAS